jgi:cytochrome c oxidase subunit 3
MSEVSTGGMKQPYHLVPPSIWPLVGALAGGLLTTGGVLYLHGYDEILLPIGVLAVLGTMFFWWRSVIKEGTILKQHSPIVSLGLRYGMLLFITSEVMFFVAFFWAYFDPAFFHGEAIQATRVLGGQWPPKGVATFDPFDIPFLNTMILLLSGCTVTWAHHAALNNDQKGLVQGLTITVLLGMLFTSLQVYEYLHAAFGFRDGVYSSTFYMATGFHGFHVLIGTIFLAVCLFRARAGHFTPERHFGLEAAAWYWHFVDVVWLFLFVCIYWLGAGDLPAAH